MKVTTLHIPADTGPLTKQDIQASREVFEFFGVEMNDELKELYRLCESDPSKENIAKLRPIMVKTIIELKQQNNPMVDAIDDVMLDSIKKKI